MRARELRQGLILSILILVCFWLLSLIWGLAGKAQIAIREAHSAKRQYGELETRRAALETNLNALGTPRGKDAAIRTAFGVAKPGEEVIVLVPPATASPTSTPSWWKRIWGWF